MQAIRTSIADVIVFQPKVFGDDRGFFFESFNQKEFDAMVMGEARFVQDNHSRSAKGVLRGLHYQIQQAQGKLVRVVQGEVLDVAVDLRKSSATFGKWVSEVLSAGNKKQLWIPTGFGHGFITRSESAEFLYKTTDYYAPQFERCIRWDDPALGIDWGIGSEPLVSAKDKAGLDFAIAEKFD